MLDTCLLLLWGALLPERLELVEEGRVFFKTGGGGDGRRKANRLLSSTIHSTSSPRANSMALGDGGRKVDVPLFAAFALDELHFGGESHCGKHLWSI